MQKHCLNLYQGAYQSQRVKIHAYYYFDYMIKVIDINSGDVLLDEKNTKIFQFMTFHAKLLWVQYHRVLGSMK